MKHTVTLEIAGTKFRLVADADAQHLNELAALVNDRVAKLGGHGRTASAAQLLALVALGLADELHTCEKKLRDIEQLTRNTIQGVITRIDTRLALGAVSASEGAALDDAADGPHEADHDRDEPDEERASRAQLDLPGAHEPRKPRARDERERS